jgi:positive regulator of sigma E activity
MRRQSAIVLYVLALVAVVVGVDILFFRHDLLERLIANVGIVLAFGAVYVRFLKRRWAQPPQDAAPRPR